MARWPSCWRRAIPGTAERAELPELTVGPLDDGGAATLLARRTPDLAPSVVDAIIGAAAGNPLALVELPGTLTDDQRGGVVSLEHPLAPGARLQRTFAQRAEELEPAARRALLIAASYDGVDLLTIAGACTRAGTDARLLEQAETQGLVRIANGRMAFTHPLIRGAVYGEAPPSDRRAAHAALADVLRDERRVWHLAAAAVGPDERVATKLERVGGAAAARRAFARASVAFERSARLTASSEAAGRRLLIAGQTASAAGEPERALALLAETAEAATSAGSRARAQHLRGRIMAWSGSQSCKPPRCWSPRRSEPRCTIACSPRRCSPTPPMPARTSTRTCAPRSSPDARSTCSATPGTRPSAPRCSPSRGGS